MAWMNGYRPQGYRNRLIVRRLPVIRYARFRDGGNPADRPAAPYGAGRWGRDCDRYLHGFVLRGAQPAMIEKVMRLLPICGLILMCAAASRAQSPVGSPDTPPGLIYRSEPEYSAEATRARVQSTV